MQTRRWLSALASLLLSAGVVAATEGLGISSWCGWRPGQVSRADCPELRSVPLVLGWNKIEPQPGGYAFDRYVGEPLRKAVADGLFVTLMVWVRPATPPWLFERGVPRVYTDRAVNPLGRAMSKEDNLHPYYLDPEYKAHFFALIDALGAYVTGLPPALRKRVLFVQSAEGSTGDGQPYKGNPLEPRYAIARPTWSVYRRETWLRYQRAFPGIPILVNSDANRAEESEWLFAHMGTLALKYGMFSHGYHVSDNGQRLRAFAALEARANQRGMPVLTRGEMDGEMFVYGWSTRNIPQALYWSALFATHARLDVWNIPAAALKDPANLPAFAFFNRYAGLHRAADSPRAFCALRDGLDASDFERFPASQFGGKEGRKRDVGRYLRIAAAFQRYGARMDDPAKALGGGMLNRKRNGYNDVGWGIVPGNYRRFLTQIAPGSGDVGLWHIDDSIYGRFGRAFEHASGKTRMRFKLDPDFRAGPLSVRVTYLDRGHGAWALVAANGSPETIVHNADSGTWKTRTMTLPGQTAAGAAFQLRHAGGDDTVFHRIEVERR